MKNNWKTFLKAAGIRAIRTIAQAALSMIGTAVVFSDVDWKMLVSAALLSGVVSILTSIVTGLPEVSTVEESEVEQ